MSQAAVYALPANTSLGTRPASINDDHKGPTWLTARTWTEQRFGRDQFKLDVHRDAFITVRSGRRWADPRVQGSTEVSVRT